MSDTEAPSLEADLPHLEELDRYRELALRLRNQGLIALEVALANQANELYARSDPAQRLATTLDVVNAQDKAPGDAAQKPPAWADLILRHPPPYLHKRYWASADEEPLDLIQPSLVILAFRRDVSRQDLKARYRRDRIIRDFLVDRLDMPFESLLSRGQQLNRSVVPAGPRQFRVPLLQAARALQGLARSGLPYALSKPAMLYYFRILFELFSIDDSGNPLGSARAAVGGVPTAFMTGECTRAISALARLLRNASELISEVIKIATLTERMDERPLLPESWKTCEINRLAMHYRTSIARLTRDAGIDHRLNSEDLDLKPGRSPRAVFDRFLKEFVKTISSIGKECALGVQGALAEIRESQSVLLNLGESLRTAPTRTFPYELAISVLERALEVATLAATVDETTPKLMALSSALSKESQGTTELLRPSTLFLESILDREIAEADEATHLVRNAPELAFAAAGYASLTKKFKDPRLNLACTILKNSITKDGTLPTVLALDTDSHGYSLEIVGSEVIRAISILMEKVEVPIEIRLIERMLTYFDGTAVGDAGQIQGWSHDMPRRPRKAYRWNTALAILALDRVVRMLDRKINQRVYRQFSVRMPEELASVRLNDLLAGDYGLTLARRARPQSTSREGDPAIFYLERMNAHIQGVNADAGARAEDCYSIALFGPPGTGKTTLVEALAASARVPLVEVTPSDIAVEGEAGMERRARCVFKALALLTRTVILFDEFDPVLRTRNANGQQPGSFFSLLTPGMLPKLKKLNDNARRRAVAFALITNRIGELDEAAIRAGRFDFKVGVYPPDVLSRMGRFLNEWYRQPNSKISLLEKDSTVSTRLLEVVARLSAVSMTFLARPGILTRTKNPVTTNLFDYVSGKGSTPDFPAAEWDKVEAAAGAGKYAARENAEWRWVFAWDQTLRKAMKLKLDFEAVSTLCQTTPVFPQPKPKRPAKRPRSPK